MTESVKSGYISGRILDGQESSNFTLSRVGEPNFPLASLSSCLVSKWSQLRLDTPDHLDKCSTKSAVSVAGLSAAFSASEEIFAQDGAILLPALETLDPQAVFFLQHAQSLCSSLTLQQRDLDRAVHSHLLGAEKLRGELSQFAQFQHFNFCPEESQYTCQTGM